MWEIFTKAFQGIATGTAGARLGIQSPHLASATVRIGRFLYSASLGWLAITWYTGYANMRTQPGSGPTIVLPGKPIIGPPDRPNKGFTPSSGSGGNGGNGGSPSGPTSGPLSSAFTKLTGGINSGVKAAGGGNLGSQDYPGLTIGRTDQGVDFSGSGPVKAIGNGKILSVGLWPGWPGLGGIVYQVPGYPPIYVMEHFQPAAGLKAGDSIKQGQVLGQAIMGGTGIETGYANAQGTGPLTPYSGKPDGTPMPGGLAYRKLLGYTN